MGLPARVRRLRRSWPIIVALLVTSLAAASVARAQYDAVPRVEVSRGELRIVFPVDTHSTWRWTDTLTNADQRWYRWGIGVDPPTGPRSVALGVGAGEWPRRFASLGALVANGRIEQCRGGMVYVCRRVRGRALVEGNRVMVVVRDSGLVADLFGARPESVTAFVQAPEVSASRTQRVPVAYVDPQLPGDSVALAAAARTRRRYLDSTRAIYQKVSTFDREFTDELWLALGDSLALELFEWRCRYDACGSTLGPRGSAWMVADSTVVTLRAARPAAQSNLYWRTFAGRWAVAQRAGTTTVTVSIPLSPSDTMPSRTPPPRQVEGRLVGTARVGRVVVSPRPDSARLGERRAFEVEVFDEGGARLDVPASLWAEHVEERTRFSGPAKDVHFRRVGTWRLVGRFGRHADTVVVVVPPGPRR